MLKTFNVKILEQAYLKLFLSSGIYFITPKVSSMSYPTAALTTVGQCDEMITLLNKQKRVMLRSKDDLVDRQDYIEGSAAGFDAEYASVIAELSNIDELIDVLPEGDGKTYHQGRKSRLVSRKNRLEKLKLDYAVSAKFQRALDIAGINEKVTETDEVLALVEARKLVLAA